MTKVIAHPDTPSLAKALATATQLHRGLEELGLSPTALQRAIDDPGFRRELVVWWESVANPAPAGSGGSSSTLAEAAQIMGGNFHGPADAKKYFDMKLGQNAFKSVPFGADTLRSVAGTHVLVAAPGLSIMGIYGEAARIFYSQRDPWFDERQQEFAQAKIAPDWYLVRKDELPNSTSKRWSDQQAMVEPPDFVPEANLAVYAYAVHYLATGERMFSRAWVRTNSVSAYGDRVLLYGYSHGLDLDSWHDAAYSGIGVAAARKSS